jgi:D-alanyl-D-alanine carboxypeptidase (penicillin-binding protein 5/6)
MYGSLLSALLLGLLPLVSTAQQSSAIAQIAVAPPAHPLVLAQSLSASGILVLDVASGQPVYAKQATVRRPMASLTKLMTALIIAENHQLDEVVTVSESATRVPGNRAYLPAGEKFTVGDLLTALLVASANDAAIVLAEYHSGSVPAFVEAMNARALQLGLNDTSYADPIGLDHADQYSTPRDIAWLSSFVLKQPVIEERMEKRWAKIYSSAGTELQLVHTHALIQQHTDSIIAGKTGTTDEARQCLVSMVEQDGRKYVVVLLYSAQRYTDMLTILRAMGAALV